MTRQLPVPRRTRLCRPWDAVASVLLIGVWLLPITYTGVMRADVPFFPDWLAYQQRVACLFTNAMDYWSTYHPQVRLQGDPADAWQELPEAGYFDMTVFGYRSKLERAMEYCQGTAWQAEAATETARFIATRWAELHPDQPLAAVRFARVVYTSRSLVGQPGAFVRQPLADVPPQQVSYFGELDLDDAAPTQLAAGRP
jgi:hypothetical protein